MNNLASSGSGPVDRPIFMLFKQCEIHFYFVFLKTVVTKITKKKPIVTFEQHVVLVYWVLRVLCCTWCVTINRDF